MLCYNDSTGSATVVFNGGVPDYLLAWGSFTLPLLNGQNVFASGTIIPQGLYPYSATDLNGCYFLILSQLTTRVVYICLFNQRL